MSYMAILKYGCTSQPPGELLKVSMSRQDQFSHSLGKSLRNQYYPKSPQVMRLGSQVREPKIRYSQGPVEVCKKRDPVLTGRHGKNKERVCGRDAVWTPDEIKTKIKWTAQGQREQRSRYAQPPQSICPVNAKNSRLWKQEFKQKGSDPNQTTSLPE